MSDHSFRDSRGQGKRRGTRKNFDDPTPFHQDRQALVLEELALNCREMTVDSLSRDASVRMLHEVAEEAYRLFDSACAESHSSPEAACHKGCSYCCYNQVSVSQVEAAYLGFYMLSKLNQAEIADLEKRVDEFSRSAGKMKSKGVVSATHEQPCIFLVNGNCSIYSARPFACRSCNSIDEDDCRMSILEHNPYVSIEDNAMIVEIADSIQGGLLRGTRNLGLESGCLPLHKAVKFMFREGVAESVGKWLQGDFFFTKAKSF